jgi:hypothetical protein
MEWGVKFFWGWSTTRWLQDPTVTTLNSHTLIFWEIDFSKYVLQLLVKKTQGILGVKLPIVKNYKKINFIFQMYFFAYNMKENLGELNDNKNSNFFCSN